MVKRATINTWIITHANRVLLDLPKTGYDEHSGSVVESFLPLLVPSCSQYTFAA